MYCSESATYTNITFSGCEFMNFKALGSASGGVFYVTVDIPVYIDGTAFRACASEKGDGGAIYMSSGTLSVSECRFVNCTAAVGGAIYFKDGKIEITGATEFSFAGRDSVYGINVSGWSDDLFNCVPASGSGSVPDPSCQPATSNGTTTGELSGGEIAVIVIVIAVGITIVVCYKKDIG